MSKLDEIFNNVEVINDDGDDCTKDTIRQVKDLIKELYVESEGVEHKFNRSVEAL